LPGAKTNSWDLGAGVKCKVCLDGHGDRHIDCAAIYRNETEVGAGIKKSGVPREEIFITGTS
jgi:diketogulonate reductase-like aldo/keto reductase